MGYGDEASRFESSHANASEYARTFPPNRHAPAARRPPEESERTRLTRRCTAVAEERRLTPREREMMELLDLLMAEQEGTARAPD